ncbi:putative phosphatidylethanolamine-binding protein [Lupinus albus]|uniref:Putative phosphatidylethanolamine-binding protein n=1 Tax=Lupinus albus TaxID=3870 RepID=A0A6A4NQM8_LUPAL|nr:putative phosphatidylethanolamine-binding protein [Lupinus albus]
MGHLIGPLVIGKVIGDVVDPFTPAAKMTILYGNKHVSNGYDIKPSLAAERPHVQISGASNASNLYTLDCCGHSRGIRCYSRELVMYMGSCPAVGIHRYVFVAFKQTGGGVVGVEAPQERQNFNTRQFASLNNLGLPVAAIYFNSHKEPKTTKFI